MAEVLIATAIAAGVLTAAAAALGGVIRLAAVANARAETLHEAQLISARLRAGLDERAVLEGLPDWRLTRESLSDDFFSGGEAPFERTVARFGEDGRVSFEMMTWRRSDAP